MSYEVKSEPWCIDSHQGMPSYSTEMEKGQFGDGVDHGNANTTEFPLDFGDILQTADGALHHHIYEFFEPGPVAPQGQQLDSTFQESAFPFPPYSAAAAPNFHHLIDENPLQVAATSNPMEQRPPNSGPHLRSTQFADRLGSHIQRSQFKAPGHGLVPISMGSQCIDHRASNLVTSTRSTAFQYTPQAQPSSAHSTPEPRLYMTSLPRGFPGYETSCAPSNLKRSGCEMETSHPRHRGMKSQKVTLGALPDHRVPKLNRPSDQVEHILRERLRRDDMTSKFRMLESLIPPSGPKRDRATIVEDSIQHVKNLHHRLKELQQKRSKMKSSYIVSPTMVKQITTARPDPAPRHATVHPVVKRSSSSRPLEINNKVTVDNDMVSSPSESNDVNGSPKTSIEKVEVHLDLPHEIVIEMTCQTHDHIQSQILAALEQLQMEVLRCSISKLHGRIMCVVVVKPQVKADSPITGDIVIRALKRAVTEV